MFGKGVFCESRLWECRVSLSFLGSRISFPFQLRNSVKAIGRDKSKHYLSKWPVVKLSGISTSQEPTSFHQQCWEHLGNKHHSFPWPLLSGDVSGLVVSPPTAPISQSLRGILLLHRALESRNIFPSAAAPGLRSSLHTQAQSLALQSASGGCAGEGMR